MVLGQDADDKCDCGEWLDADGLCWICDDEDDDELDDFDDDFDDDGPF